jgi:hypothetical protein
VHDPLARSRRGCAICSSATVVRPLPALAGRRVDEERVRFYEVLATIKMAAIMLTGIHAWREGRTLDLRMALFDHQWAYMAVAIAQARGLM